MAKQRAPKETLTPAQLTAIAALAAGSTATEAAAKAGVDRRTVARWQADDPFFAAELNGLLAEAKEKIGADLRALASDAVATVRAVMTDPQTPPAVRLKAAWGVLEAARTQYVGETDPNELADEMIETNPFKDLLRFKGLGTAAASGAAR